MPTRPIKIELYHGYHADGPAHHTDGHWGWRWTARRGGRIIATSTEAYTERIAAVRNIALVFDISNLVWAGHGKRNVDFTTTRANGIVIEVKTQ